MPVTNVPPQFKAGAIGDVYRCSVVMQSNFGAHVNTFHLRQVVAAFTGDVFADIHTTWDGVVKPSYRAIFPASYVIRQFRVAQVDDKITGLPAVTYAHSDAGLRVPTGDALPPQNSALLIEDTGFSGRRGRGRQFIGGIYETDQAAGVINTAFQTLIQAYGDALRTNFKAGSSVAELGVFTLVSNSFIAVTATTVPLTVYTQRRRRLGVGA